MDNATAVKVSGIINNLPVIDKYGTINGAIICVFGLAQEVRDAIKKFPLLGLGDEKNPTGLL